MAREIILPKLGMDMISGTIIEWFIEEGDFVKKGDPLLEILTDKVNIEVEAESSGVLLKRIGKIDEQYPVFTVIGYLGEEGEAIPETGIEKKPKAVEKSAKIKQDQSKTFPIPMEVPREKTPEATQPRSMEDLRFQRETELGLGKVRATPAARRLAKQHHIIIENILGTGPSRRIQFEDVEAVVATQPSSSGSPEPVVISKELEEITGNPENILAGYKQKESLAQRVPGLAEFMSIVDDLDLTPRLDAREPDGRVVPGELDSIKRFQENEDNFSGDYGEYIKVLSKRVEETFKQIKTEKNPTEIIPNPELDFVPFVEDSIEQMRDEIEVKAVVVRPSPKIEKKESTTKTTFSGKRKIIADRMVKSNLENAVITLTTEIDMSEVKDLRKKISKKIEDEIQYRCTFTDFLLMAVSRALIKHPGINSSLIEKEIIKHPYVHMGLAVGMDDGLIVPVIRNAHELTFVEMVKNRAETLKAVKNKYIDQEDLKGSTFTITNLGMYGVLDFTAIINQPNSAILSVGEVVQRMRLYQGEPMMRSVMKISLNLDHRVADGMEGAKFLQDVKVDMENPSLLLF